MNKNFLVTNNPSLDDDIIQAVQGVIADGVGTDDAMPSLLFH